MAKSLSLFVGKRYASLQGRNLLVGFISILSILGLSLGVAILVTVLSILNGFDRELQERILALVPHITVTNYRNQRQLSQDEWQTQQLLIDDIDGIKGSAPHLQLQGMLLANGRSKGVILNGIEPEQERNISILEDFITAGEYASLNAGDFNLLIGKGLADNLNVEVGDSLSLVSTVVSVTPLGGYPRHKSFTVAGIFNVGSQLDNNLAIAHIQDAQLLYRLGNKINGVRVQVDDLFAVDNSINKLREVLPNDYSYSDWTRDYGSIYENIRFSKTLIALLLSLLVAVAAFNVVVSLVMVVKDKEGDIAILRTMGTSTGSIRNIFLVQGFIIGLMGTALGLVLGIIFSLTISDIVNGLEGLLNVQFLSEDIYPINYLPSQIQISDLLLVAGVSLSLCLLATVFPARAAAKIDPAETLRFE